MKTPEYNPADYDFSMHAEGLYVATKKGDTLLDNVNVSIGQGEHVAIHGPSGAGKSLLATALCGIRARDLTYQGSVGYELTARGNAQEIKQSEVGNVLKRHIGFVPQEALLDPNMSAMKNILTPNRIKQIPINGEVLDEVCSRLGLERSLLEQKARTLSGGQKQRVAIARAFAHNPNVVILDEPTAALNQELKDETNDMLNDLVETLGTTIVSVTHEDSLASRRIEMADGKIKSDIRHKSPEDGQLSFDYL